MRVKRLVLTILFCLALPLIANAQQTQTPQQPRRTPLYVGVVDLQELIKAHPITATEVPALQAELQKDKLEADKKQREYEKQMEQVSKEFKYGSPQFEDAVQPIKEGMRTLQNEMQDKLAEMQKRATPLQYQVYSDIQKAVDAVAREKGIVVVHTKLKIDRTGISEEVAAVQEADLNPTLVWNRPECDLTEAVKAKLSEITGGNGSNLGGLAAQAAEKAVGGSNNDAVATQPQPARQAAPSRTANAGRLTSGEAR